MPCTSRDAICNRQYALARCRRAVTVIRAAFAGNAEENDAVVRALERRNFVCVIAAMVPNPVPVVPNRVPVYMAWHGIRAKTCDGSAAQASRQNSTIRPWPKGLFMPAQIRANMVTDAEHGHETHQQLGWLLGLPL